MADHDGDTSDRTPLPPETSAEHGAILSDPHHEREDIRLLQRFPIPPEKRAAVAKAMLRIALGSDKPRNRIMATRALVALDKLNMEQEKRTLGIPDTVVNVVQQVSLTQAEINAMDASILPPAEAAMLALRLAKAHGNGNGSNGNGNGNAGH